MRAGGPYVADPGLLLRDMRRSTLGLWAAMNVIDPFDGYRDDMNAAILAAATMSAQGAKKEGGDAFEPSDFLHFHRMQQMPEDTSKKQISELRAFLDARVSKKA